MVVSNDSPLLARVNAQRFGILLLWAFLLSPLALNPLLNPNQRVVDGLFLFNVATSVLWVVLLHALVRRPLFLHLALAPLYLTTAIDLFLLWTFKARLSSGYVTIALTDYADAGELLASYASSVSLAAAVLAGAYLPGLFLIRRVHRARKLGLAALALVLLTALYGVAIGRGLRSGVLPTRVLMDVVGKEMGAPFGAVAQTGLALQLHAASRDLRRLRDGFSFAATKPASERGEVYVWVIGESARPQNWSMFGYRRQTNPLLGSMAGITALPDMLTTAPHTSVAVPSMLSLAPITDWPAITASKSVVGAFNEVGFKTYWLSAQEADSWGGLIPQIAAEAKRRRYFDRAQDGAMLGEFHAILQSAAPGDKLFIVLHTKGSHFEYSRRYPPAFARFGSPDPSRRERLIDEYDNSILYTDWFLSEVINGLAARKGNSALIYASDHGENLLDDKQQLFGHALGNDYDLPAAAFIWLSDGLRRSQPEQMQALQRNSGAHLSLSNLPHSLLDLAGIQARGFDAQASLFNSRFEAKPRWYMVRGDLRREQHPAPLAP